MRKIILLIGAMIVSIAIFSCGKQEPFMTSSFEPQETTLTKQGAQGDPQILAIMDGINQQLQAQGLNIAVESIEFFTIGKKRPSNRIHQQPFRWVPGDPRRLADGANITYIVDQSGGATSSGLTNAQTEAEVDAAMNTWNSQQELRKVNIIKRTDPGTDITIFDFFLGAGGFGNPFAADIVNAGWFPPGPPFFGPNTLAFSVTFIFISGGGVPTDINGDNYLDTALNEIYYNDGFNWGINNAPLPQIDVQTVALHELGHSLGIGHFGPPPTAVMNPVYAGPRTTPLPPDLAGMAAVWGSWPNP